MATPEVLRREIKALAFDQYGTIVDMQKGLTEAVTPFLERKGWDGKPHSFVTWWRRTHFENSMIDALCDRGHTPYREIGQRAVAYVLERCGIGYTADEVRSLVSEIEKLKPFPDVVAALAKLRAKGYTLVILSNGDRDMLAAAGPHIAFASIRSSQSRRPAISSRTGRPTPRPPRSCAKTLPAFCSSPITPSTASGQNPMACAPPSLTGASGRSAKPRISPIWWWLISPNLPPSWLEVCLAACFCACPSPWCGHDHRRERA